jgi:hypothetical protein
VLTLRRARRPLAIVCVAVIALAVFVPGVAALDCAPPPLEFVLLPRLEPLGLVASVPVPAEQPEALRAVLPKRGPPPFVAAGL